MSDIEAIRQLDQLRVEMLVLEREYEEEIVVLKEELAVRDVELVGLRQQLAETETYAAEGWAWLDKALGALGAKTVFEIERTTAVQDVLTERRRQSERWTPEHDDHHQPQAFAALIEARTAHIRACDGDGPTLEVRKKFVQAAALALAAIESIDRRLAARVVEGDA